MMRQDGSNAGTTASASTRRDAVKVGGGIGLALLAAGFGGRAAVVAQQATPAASPGAGGLEGRYAVVRLRQLAADQTADEVMGLIREGYVPLAQAISGFVSYTGIADPASGSTAFIAVYADKAGADESTRVAGDWLEENGYAFFEGDPEVVEGEIDIAVEGDA